MKLESFKPLKQEDVDSQYRGLIGKIGFSINSFCSQIVNAFNNNLTITDNLNRELRTITLTVNSSGKPTATTEFQLTTLKNTKISGMNVIKVQNNTNSTAYATAWPGIYYSQNNNVITILNVPGLLANNKYTLTLEIIGV